MYFDQYIVPSNSIAIGNMSINYLIYNHTINTEIVYFLETQIDNTCKIKT